MPVECAGLTSEKLREEGAFLWENGAEAILFFGQRVPPELIRAAIGEAVPLANGIGSNTSHPSMKSMQALAVKQRRY